MAEHLCSAKVTESGRAMGLTSTSKILHMCVFNFFVMSDENIRYEYGCKANAKRYTNFMIRMSLLVQDLLQQAKDEKEHICPHDGRSVKLTKVLDQYNYVITRSNKDKK